MERVVSSTAFTRVVALDGPIYGAHHHYQVDSNPGVNQVGQVYSDVRFQKGPVLDNGHNGCTNEDLIEIVLDRLRGFQQTDFACRENAIAITKLEEALHWLNHRTAERSARGVEGTNEV